MTPTFLWHDYETTGTDPARDRPLQFAAIRTDLDLNPVGEPLSLLCMPPRDSLPQPQACLVTGITPQQAERDGVAEVDFAAAVHECLAAPGTCGVGYNSLRFDDAFTRHLLYRNFYDPYAREWRSGNSRWDIIDLARMCHALRPEGIEWPQREDGTPSFKLEHLAAANHLAQRRAHDALSDVEATIALARLLRQRQPRLWAWYLALRDKRKAASLLDCVHMTPLLHVSSRYCASQRCLSVIAPLAPHPLRGGEVIVLDLAIDPTDLLRLDADALADRVFTARADLPDDVQRVLLRTIHLNRSPALAPLSVLRADDAARLHLDIDACLANAARLRAASGLAEKVRQVFAAAATHPPAEDPELALYEAFLSDADRPLLERVRATAPAQLRPAAFPFRDPRYRELLFRYRARNDPESLNAGECARWTRFCRKRLSRNTPLTTLTLTAYFTAIGELRCGATGAQRALLDHLDNWGLELAEMYEFDQQQFANIIDAGAPIPF